MTKNLLIFALLFCLNSLCALDWEPDSPDTLISNTGSSSLDNHSILNRAVHKYRQNSSEHSVPRCPFNTSCSALFIKTLHNKGMFMAFLTYIDRTHFREHPGTRYYYPFKMTKYPPRMILYDQMDEL